MVGDEGLRRCLAVLAALLAAVAASARPPGDWVTVVLEDGREFYGEVVAEAPDRITIRHRVGSIDAELSFTVVEIAEIRVDRTLEESALDPADAPEQATPAVEETGGWVLVPARGSIGVELTRNLFVTAVEKAQQAGAEVIVFHLTSPGGYLSSLDAIHRGLEPLAREIDVVFYVDDECFSAAAMLCMASEHFYVGPGAAFGAAVAYVPGQNGPSAVDAKFESANAAIWRTRAEAVGRPGLLMDAMIRMETEVWADTASTPWTLSPTRPAGGEAIELDGPSSVLSLTYENATPSGAADGDAASVTALLAMLGVGEREALDGAELASNVIRHQARRIREIDQRIDFIDEVVGRIAEGAEDAEVDARELLGELRRVQRGLRVIERMRRELDYVRAHCDRRGVTAEQIEEFGDLVDDAVRRLRDR